MRGSRELDILKSILGFIGQSDEDPVVQVRCNKCMDEISESGSDLFCLSRKQKRFYLQSQTLTWFCKVLLVNISKPLRTQMEPYNSKVVHCGRIYLWLNE